MNATELAAALQEVISEEYGNSEFLELIELNEKIIAEAEEEYAKKDRKILAAVGPFEQVFHSRVGGDASIMRSVYHFKDHDIYLCLDGEYSSWDATSYRQGWYEVKPEKVTSIKYKRVK